MVKAAFAEGVKYCDTAPAYDQSQDYYGAAFRETPGAREQAGGRQQTGRAASTADCHQPDAGDRAISRRR